MTADPSASPLSVVIPVRDSELTLRDAVRSVLDQDVPGIEVIVVDDGSAEDPTPLLQDHLEAGAVRMVRQRNLGVSVARNVGLAAATSAHVMFVDADDQLVPGSLGPFMRAALDSAADVTVADFYLRRGTVDTSIRALNTSRTDFDERDRGVLQWLTLARVGFDGKKNVGLLGAPWAKIYRRAFLLEGLNRDAVFAPGVLRGQDVLLNTEVFGTARSVHYWQAPCYVYTVSETSASHRQAADFVARVRTLADAIEDLIQCYDWDGLRPAAAKMTVTLLDEALQREQLSQDRTRVDLLLRRDPFATALRQARLRDFSFAGRVKLLAFRSGSLATMALVKALARIADRRAATQ